MEHKSSSSKLPFGLVFGVLFVFWLAVAVCVGAIVIASAWDAREDDAMAAVPIVTPTTPVATATPDARPPAVPLTASPVEGEFDSGEPAQHLFFDLHCSADVLVIITTDEHVYAETACPPRIEPVYIAPFQGDPVRVTIAEGLLEMATVAGERLTFDIGRAWIERP